MKIIILGAGQVGGTLAEHLAREENDITVVDTDADKLRELHTKLDIRTPSGCKVLSVVRKGVVLIALSLDVSNRRSTG